MTNYLKSLATWLLFFFATAASAQETSVSGTVLENTKNQPLEGVTVKVGNNQLLYVVDGSIVDNSTNI